MSTESAPESDHMRRVAALRLLGRYITPARDAWEMEAAIHSYITSAPSTTLVPDFEAKVRQIAWNVSVSPGLLQKYTPSVLVHLDDTTLAAGTDVERWHTTHAASMEQHALLREEHKVDADVNSGALTCNRCLSHDVEVHQKQTRSADEGMTVFCVCNKCGMRWKM